MLGKGRNFWSPDSEDAALIIITLLPFFRSRWSRFSDRYLSGEALAKIDAVVAFFVSVF
jgi:hypothetical protein